MEPHVPEYDVAPGNDATSLIVVSSRPTEKIPESGVPPGANDLPDPHDKALFHIQEKFRFEQPDKPYTYIINSKENHVGSVRKEPKQRFKSFSSIMTEPRPASVNVFSLVRDAIARLPNGVGSVADIVNLLSQSQYLSSKKTSQIVDVVAYCVPLLAKEQFPCVAFNEETKQFSYLQHGFSVHEHKTLEEEMTKPTDSKGKKTGQRKKRSPPVRVNNVSAETVSVLLQDVVGDNVAIPVNSAVANTTSFVSTSTDSSDKAFDEEGSIGKETDSVPSVYDFANANESTVVLTLNGFDEEIESRCLTINQEPNVAQKFEVKGVPTRWTDDQFLEAIKAQILPQLGQLVA